MLFSRLSLGVMMKMIEDVNVNANMNMKQIMVPSVYMTKASR